ncbi:MAG TPA: hypothetical protein VMV27_09225 [Candidatus Binataceae bacterium]|nr:hypothetical protein [Candidatus Binataceae bacterium]
MDTLRTLRSGKANGTDFLPAQRYLLANASRIDRFDQPVLNADVDHLRMAGGWNSDKQQRRGGGAEHPAQRLIESFRHRDALPIPIQ